MKPQSFSFFVDFSCRLVDCGSKWTNRESRGHTSASCLLTGKKKWASQTRTEFDTNTTTSVPFPVVTPTATDCLREQLINEFLIRLPVERRWLSHRQGTLQWAPEAARKRSILRWPGQTLLLTLLMCVCDVRLSAISDWAVCSPVEEADTPDWPHLLLAIEMLATPFTGHCWWVHLLILFCIKSCLCTKCWVN